MATSRRVAAVIVAAVMAGPLSVHAAADKQILKDETGAVHNVTGSLGTVSGSSAEARALTALDRVRGDFGFEKSSGNFKMRATSKDEAGVTHTKLDRVINGIPVYGEQMIVHERNGVLRGVTGRWRTLTPNTAEPKIEGAEAVDRALTEVRVSDELAPAPTAELVYLPKGDTAHLAFVVKISHLGEMPGNWLVFINAVDGTLLKATNRLATASIVSSGTGVLGDSKAVNTEYTNGTYYLRDVTKSVDGAIETMDFRNGSSVQYLFSNAYPSWNASVHRSAVDAHVYTGKVYDFYKNTFGFSSIDGKGGAIRIGVHFGNKYNNAFWNGAQFGYGDGDGTTFIALSGAPDIVAHEYTHAVLQNLVGLDYSGQSGALRSPGQMPLPRRSTAMIGSLESRSTPPARPVAASDRCQVPPCTAVRITSATLSSPRRTTAASI